MFKKRDEKLGAIMKDVRAGIRWVSLVLFAFVLSACAETEFAAHVAKRITRTTEETPSPRYKVGDPYPIDGIWYYPAENYEYEETGIASWYGPQFHGKRTANGEIYDMNTLTAAHRTLPMPSFVRVTNLLIFPGGGRSCWDSTMLAPPGSGFRLWLIKAERLRQGRNPKFSWPRSVHR